MYFRISMLSKCQLLYRDTIAATIRHICKRLEEQGEPETFGHQVISAFNEAFNNLANHGGPDIDEKEVLITVSVTDLQLIIEMDDDAQGFHPPPPEPRPENPRESGMGLIIIREFMDSMEYKKRTFNGVNSLRMVRNLTKAPKYV